ncbi:uncharacterized protein LOC113395305 [Vanessa tameamea]|uniref:Regulatory protein zeste n=1 Tax=Vanessa tameamea TaxID=334116 RepID=A0A8B8HWH2_VANTA
MERRKASPEQLNMLLHFLEEDKELAIGKFTGLEGRIRQTNAWIKITEKLNASSGFGSGTIKTPDKWRQAWRDWKSNVKKKAFKIRKNHFTPGSGVNTQLTAAEEKILKLISTKSTAFGFSGVRETSAVIDNNIVNSESNTRGDDSCSANPASSNVKWEPDNQHFNRSLLDNTVLGDRLNNVPDNGTNEISSAPVIEKPFWRKKRRVRFVHDRVLNLEEERIKIEKQKLLEKKRCNNIRLKIEMFY